MQEAVSHGFAESGTAAGDEDALVMEKIVAKHEFVTPIRKSNLVIPNRAKARGGTCFWFAGMTNYMG
jgi:hypothetical protein